MRSTLLKIVAPLVMLAALALSPMAVAADDEEEAPPEPTAAQAATGSLIDELGWLVMECYGGATSITISIDPGDEETTSGNLAVITVVYDENTSYSAVLDGDFLDKCIQKTSLDSDEADEAFGLVMDALDALLALFNS